MEPGRCTPGSGAGRWPGCLSCGERQQPKEGERSVLGDCRQVHDDGGSAYSQIVEQSDSDHGSCREQPYLRRRHGHEVAEVFSKDGGNSTEGGGTDNRELGPSEKEGGQRTESFQDVGEHSTGPRKSAGE